MKINLFAFTLLLLAIASAQDRSQPIKFRGAYIGEPLSEFVDCDGGKGKLIKEGYKLHGKLCDGKKGIVYRTHTHGFMAPKTEGEVFTFEDRRLVQIKIEISNEDWAKVKYDLSQKLGEPQSEVPQVFQNGFGARWEYDQGFWVKQDIVAYAGIKVETLGNEAIRNPFTNQPDTQGIEVTITDAIHAKLPQTRPNSLD
jgi:hypothetical protein